MKKVRIVLSGLAILAVVGTTLAFSSKRTALFVYRIDGNKCPKIGKADIGSTQFFNVYTTSVDAGATVPTAKCNQSPFLTLQP